MRTKEVSYKEFQIKRLGRQDLLLFQKLIRLFEVVFEIKKTATVKASYLKPLLAKHDFIIYAVIHKNEIIGGLTAYILPIYYSQHSEIFIYDIAIKPEFQRKGLGKKLLSALKEGCKQNKIKEIFVAAHEKDKHALKFYKSTGAQGEKVIHFSWLTQNK